jgi:hypothetical protein
MSEEVNPLEEELRAKVEAMTQESQERRQALIRQAAEEGTYYPGGVNMTNFFREIRELQAELAAEKGNAEEPVEEVTAPEEVETTEVETEGQEPEVVEEPEVVSEPEAEPVEEPEEVEEPQEAPEPEPAPEEKPAPKKRAPRKKAEEPSE